MSREERKVLKAVKKQFPRNSTVKVLCSIKIGKKTLKNRIGQVLNHTAYTDGEDKSYCSVLIKFTVHKADIRFVRHTNLELVSTEKPKL